MFPSMRPVQAAHTPQAIWQDLQLSQLSKAFLEDLDIGHPSFFHSFTRCQQFVVGHGVARCSSGSHIAGQSLELSFATASICEMLP